MNKKLFNQNGLTLIELLAVIVLTAIVSLLLFSITTKAIETTTIINQETVLRDEADIIISKFIKSLYSTREEHIIDHVSNAENSYLNVVKEITKCPKNANGNYIIKKGECELFTIGFKTENETTKIYIMDEVYSIANQNIHVKSSSNIIKKPNSSSLYEINLALKITHKRGNKVSKKEMTFTNEIQPILSSN